MPDSILEQFSEEWSYFDPDASTVMPTKHLADLVQKLEPPLGPGTLHILEQLQHMRFGVQARAASWS